MNAKRYLLMLVLVALLALAAPVIAAEEEVANTEIIADGASLLVMLIGIAAVGIVGGASLLREQFRRVNQDHDAGATGH